MKTFLVTGGAGFIGSRVIGSLLTEGHKVVCLEKLSYSGDLNKLADILSDIPETNKQNLKIVYHDLRAEITRQLNPYDITHILHFAAGTHVDNSISDPVSFVYDNVVGTANLLNYARTLETLEHFIYFSTDEVFGPAAPGVSFSEYDRLNATNPYAASKAGAEEMCTSFNNTYSMPISIVRLMNVFGEYQYPEKFIPLCIKKILNGETITIHSDKSKTISGSRYYIHVSDVIDGMNFVIDRGYIPRDNPTGVKIPKYNLVGKEEITNLDLAKFIASALDKDLNYEMVDFHSSRPGHDLRYALSGEYMKSLGWEPKVALSQRIKQVVDWYVNHNEWLQ